MEDNKTLKPREMNEAVDILFEKSRLSLDFYIMLILSAIIVSLGLLLNNVTIIIGGMLVTPMLSPILVLALGVIVAEKKVIWRSFKVLYKSIAVVLGVSIIITWISPTVINDSELISRTFINISFFYVALAAGVAAAYAWVRPNLSDALPGVAISVAILPPLATLGIGIAIWDMNFALGGLRLFVGNLIGIVIASAIVFAMTGFRRTRHEATKEVEAEEKAEIKKTLERQQEQDKLINKAQEETDKRI